MSEAEHVARDYVYCGVRLAKNDNDRFVEIRVINEDGTLSDGSWYKYKRSFERTIGAVYSGATFNGQGQVRGLVEARFKGMWDKAEDRIEWKSLEEAALSKVKLKRMEADAGRVSDLEASLKDARKLYSKLRQQFDSAGCRALDQLVLAALHTPLRKIEGGEDD